MTDGQLVDGAVAYAYATVMLAVFWFSMALLLLLVRRVIEWVDAKRERRLASVHADAQLALYWGDEPQWGESRG